MMLKLLEYQEDYMKYMRLVKAINMVSYSLLSSVMSNNDLFIIIILRSLHINDQCRRSSAILP
jgi:hypothetical protein